MTTDQIKQKKDSGAGRLLEYSQMSVKFPMIFRGNFEAFHHILKFLINKYPIFHATPNCCLRDAGWGGWKLALVFMSNVIRTSDF
jgi:hypothetical protein